MWPVLAQMGWSPDHMGGWWGTWMWIGMAVFWLTVIALVAWAVVRSTSASQQPRATSPEDVLAERFARGDIEADEYRERLDELRR